MTLTSRPRRLHGAVALSLALGLSSLTSAPTGLAAAAEDPATSAPEISSVMVVDDHSVVQFNLDSPVPGAKADQLAEEVKDAYGPEVDLEDLTISFPPAGSQGPNQAVAALRGPAAARVQAAAAEAYLSCGNTWSQTDSNGRIRLSYRCNLTPKRVAWDYKIAICPVITGGVREQGLRWWRNSNVMPQNAPHAEGCLYDWHGTMNPAPVGSHVEYQDYFTFRHTIGSGGSGSITFAGRYYARRCEEC